MRLPADTVAAVRILRKELTDLRMRADDNDSVELKIAVPRPLLESDAFTGWMTELTLLGDFVQWDTVPCSSNKDVLSLLWAWGTCAAEERKCREHNLAA